MNVNEFILKSNPFPRKQLSELNHPLDPHLRPECHRFSQPSNKPNLIKINKHKLPSDFFPKKDLVSRRHPLFPNELTEPIRLEKKAESQRKHYSPERTSFFGSEQDLHSQPKLRVSGGNPFLTRKFETRQEPKRDIYALEPTRKLNTAAKTYKQDMLHLYPCNYDIQIHQLLTASSKTHQLRSPTKKNICSKMGENLCLDPQASLECDCTARGKLDMKLESKLSTNNCSVEQNGEILNITFYNAKSSCFPPINRHPNKPA